MCPRRPKKEDELSFFQIIGNNLRELNWETSGFERGVRESIGRIGSRMTSMLGQSQTDSVKAYLLALQNYAKKNPFTSMVVGFFLAAILIPILIFLSFAVITVLIGFGSFVVIEGTIITIATFFLGFALLTVGVIAGSFTLTTLAIFWVLGRIRKLAGEVLVGGKGIVENEVEVEGDSGLVQSD